MISAIDHGCMIVAVTIIFAAGAGGIAAIFSLLGVVGVALVIFYSVLLFLLPVIVWKCLRRLNTIIDELRALRTGNPTPTAQHSPWLHPSSGQTQPASKPVKMFSFEEPE